jgi:hypothetical protein
MAINTVNPHARNNAIMAGWEMASKQDDCMQQFSNVAVHLKTYPVELKHAQKSSLKRA